MLRFRMMEEFMLSFRMMEELTPVVFGDMKKVVFGARR